jgi:hypothetical protein
MIFILKKMLILEIEKVEQDGIFSHSAFLFSRRKIRGVGNNFS